MIPFTSLIGRSFAIDLLLLRVWYSNLASDGRLRPLSSWYMADQHTPAGRKDLALFFCCYRWEQLGKADVSFMPSITLENKWTSVWPLDFMVLQSPGEVEDIPRGLRHTLRQQNLAQRGTRVPVLDYIQIIIIYQMSRTISWSLGGVSNASPKDWCHWTTFSEAYNAPFRLICQLAVGDCRPKTSSLVDSSWLGAFLSSVRVNSFVASIHSFIPTNVRPSLRATNSSLLLRYSWNERGLSSYLANL